MILIAGIDEAGRGPLAGPVVASAVILDPSEPIDGLADSKKLTARRRTDLCGEIESRALCSATGWSDPAEIDSINILQATFLAMRRAILALSLKPGFVEVDGNRLPLLEFHHWSVSGEAIVKGDDKVAAISAASILAKVKRDDFMRRMDNLYPVYGFARHKGYGTAEHRRNIQRFGSCRLHRRSFRGAVS